MPDAQNTASTTEQRELDKLRKYLQWGTGERAYLERIVSRMERMYQEGVALEDERDRLVSRLAGMEQENFRARELVLEAKGYLRNGSGHREQVASWLGDATDWINGHA